MIWPFGRKAAAEPEHAVIVHIPFASDSFGSEEERELAFALEMELAEAVNASGSGEFDGNEFGGGECVFFMYGRDADALYAVVEPILKSNLFATSGFAIKRYGEASDANAREVRMNWDTR